MTAEQSKPRPMSEAPRDGTVILAFMVGGSCVTAYWGQSGGRFEEAWRASWGCALLEKEAPLLGWLPCPTYTGEAV